MPAIPKLNNGEVERMRVMRDGRGPMFAGEGMTWAQVAFAFRDDAGRARRHESLVTHYNLARAEHRGAQEKAA